MFLIIENIGRVMIHFGIGFQFRVRCGEGRNQAGAVHSGTCFDAYAVRLVTAVWVIFWRIGIFWWFHVFIPFQAVYKWFLTLSSVPEPNDLPAHASFCEERTRLFGK